MTQLSRRLAQMAIASTERYTGALAQPVIDQLQIAFVAQWLYGCDEGTRAAAAETACAAIDVLVQHQNRD